MWRTDCTGLRPKWGIYRYLGENRSWQDRLRDEESVLLISLSKTLERDFKNNIRKGQTIVLSIMVVLLSEIYLRVLDWSRVLILGGIDI